MNTPIFHMASLARSGETMLLKSLTTHPNIKVVHNINAVETPENVSLFSFLRSFEQNEIHFEHPEVKHLNLKPGDIILIKQGVWKHPTTFKGFILARNPASVFYSLMNYDNEKWKGAEKRIKRWSKDMCPEILEHFDEKSSVEQFCLFYNTRMKELLSRGLPIIKYENLVRDKENELRDICILLGVPFQKEIVEAHKKYRSGEIGHGKNDLGRKIDTSSLEKYKSLPKEYIDHIMELTQVVTKKLGYEYYSANGRMIVKKEVGNTHLF